MSFFRKYKTIEELLFGFLLEKESTTQYKTYQSYRCNIGVFIDWLESQGI